MKRSSFLIGFVSLLLVSCTRIVPPVPPGAQETSSSSASTEESSAVEIIESSSSSESSAPSAREATVEGRLQKAGVGIYMQGTHRLITDDTGQELLLQSSTVNLDDYVEGHVRVAGTVRPTVEAGGSIMNVVSVERMESEAAAVLEESSSSSEEVISSSPSSSSAALSVRSSSSSSAPSSSSASSRSSSSKTSSSSAVSSSSSIALTSSSASADLSASVKTMMKAVVDAANFTQRYCTNHIGFCIPLHRNWYFQSFGATVAPSLWHVEVADHLVEEVGDGVILLNLLPGALSAGESEGSAVTQGDFVVASRQWTGNRHFEISAPKELTTAVEYMAQGLVVYEEIAQ